MRASSRWSRSLTSRPRSTYSPDVGVSRQPIMFISVDLPLPDGPSTLKNSPSSIDRFTCLSTICSSSPIL